MKTIILQAAILGTKAFNSGKKSTPCMDKELNKLIKDNESSDKEFGWTLDLLKAWTKSWHDANLSNVKVA